MDAAAKQIPNPEPRIPNPESPAPRPPSRAPRGFTLVELLVVITIMVILMGLAATMVRPATEGRRIREAARSVNVYLASARNRALEIGRPCGVVFRSFNGNSAFAMTADQCEVPATYCGLLENSTAAVMLNGGSITAVLSDALTIGFVRPGDLIQFNYQGSYGAVGGTANGNQVDPTTGYVTGNTITVLNTDPLQNPSVPWSATPISVPYRIFRSPMKAGAEPLQLPAATVVDFTASGVGPGLGPADVTVLFGPDGGVKNLYLGAAPLGAPAGPIYLLIGKRERMLNAAGGATESTWANYQDLGNLWIVVNPQTGLITTEPVGSLSGGVPGDPINARELAGQAIGMGGK